MPKGPFSWDDLRLVLGIARAGNLVAAAQTLGVNHSTVFRRLNALEKDIGSKLFERLAAGYQPTEAGHRLIATAELMEEQALALDRDLTGRDARLSGTLRVTASDTMSFFCILTDEIAAFHKLHPGILVELAVDNRVYDLSRREADVAFRAQRPTQGDLFGRKLVDIRWALFASADYLKANPAPVTLKTLAKHQVIGWSGPALTKAAAWIAANVPPEAIGFRSTGLINQFMAARAGMGLALLPTYLATADPKLKRAFGPLKDLFTDFWIVTHRSLKDTARVRTFMTIVGEGVKRKLSAFEN